MRAWTGGVWLGVALSTWGCAAEEEGLVIFEVTQAQTVPVIDWVAITARGETQRFDGALKPGLYLPEGGHEVRIVGLRDDREVARALDVEHVMVPAGKITRVRVLLVPSDDVRLDGSMPEDGDTPMDGAFDEDAATDAEVDANGMDGAADGATDTGMDMDAGDGDASAMGDADAKDADAPVVPRNAACGAADAGAPEVVLDESFDGWAIGPPDEAVDAQWVEAAASRTGSITTVWAHTGQCLVVESFTTSVEWLYRRLPLASQPATLTLELYYAADGYIVNYKDFAEVGFAFVGANKFDVTDAVSLRAQDHSLLFNDAPPTPPTVGVTQGGTSVYEEIEYRRQVSGDQPYHHYLRLELDLCEDRARIYVGSDPLAPLRDTIDFDALPLLLNGVYVAGGVSATHIDGLRVTATGEGL